MSFSTFNEIQKEILPPITEFTAKSSEIISWVTPLILTGVTIALIIYGYEVLRGNSGNQYFLDAFAKIARPIIVFHIALAGGAYANTVVSFVMDLRTDLTKLFGAKGENSYIALYNTIGSAIEALQSLLPIAAQQISIFEGNLQGLVIYVCIAIIFGIILVYGALATFNLIMIDAGLSIILGIGPLFVAAFAFQSTSKFFDSWFNTALKYSLSGALITGVIGISNGIFYKFSVAVSKMNGESVNIIGAAAAAIASCVVLILLIYKSTTIAADIFGGSGISFTGAQTAAKAAAGTYGAAASTAGAAGSLAKKAVQTFGSNTQSNGALVVLQAGEAMRNNSNSRGIGSISPTNNAPPSRRPIPSVNSK